MGKFSSNCQIFNLNNSSNSSNNSNNNSNNTNNFKRFQNLGIFYIFFFASFELLFFCHSPSYFNLKKKTKQKWLCRIIILSKYYYIFCAIINFMFLMYENYKLKMRKC